MIQVDVVGCWTCSLQVVVHSATLRSSGWKICKRKSCPDLLKDVLQWAATYSSWCCGQSFMDDNWPHFATSEHAVGFTDYPCSGSDSGLWRVNGNGEQILTELEGFFYNRPPHLVKWKVNSTSTQTQGKLLYAQEPFTQALPPLFKLSHVWGGGGQRSDILHTGRWIREAAHVGCIVSPGPFCKSVCEVVWFCKERILQFDFLVPVLGLIPSQNAAIRLTERQSWGYSRPLLSSRLTQLIC